jgi:hypothetical protein
MRRLLSGVCVFALVLACAASARAQAAAPARQDRQVGRAGAVQLGVSGFLDKFFTSSDTTQPAFYNVSFDVGKFMTDRFVAKAGIVGSGTFGGASGGVDTGGGGAQLFGQAGLLFYVSPGSVTSPYLGAEYSTVLTNRQSGDNGTILAKVGVQTALSARSSIFFEGGYGFAVSAPSFQGVASERTQQFTGQFGLRFLF